MIDVLSRVPARAGHFLLESGCHTDLWLTLDALFVDPASIGPLVDALAARLRPYATSAICGSLLGGAFLAQALAAALGQRFYFSEPCPRAPRPGLFTAEYRLRPDLAQRIRGEHLAVVDDVISAGSSARATVRAAESAAADVRVVAALMVLGSDGLAHFTRTGIRVEALEYRDFNVWSPDDCPLCRDGRALEDPAG